MRHSPAAHASWAWMLAAESTRKRIPCPTLRRIAHPPIPCILRQPCNLCRPQASGRAPPVQAAGSQAARPVHITPRAKHQFRGCPEPAAATCDGCWRNPPQCSMAAQSAGCGIPESQPRGHSLTPMHMHCVLSSSTFYVNPAPLQPPRRAGAETVPNNRIHRRVLSIAMVMTLYHRKEATTNAWLHTAKTGVAPSPAAAPHNSPHALSKLIGAKSALWRLRCCS